MSLQITFSKSAGALVWNLIKPAIKDFTCPFCGTKITRRTFAGATHYEGQPRLLHNSLPYLLDLVKETRS